MRGVSGYIKKKATQAAALDCQFRTRLEFLVSMQNTSAPEGRQAQLAATMNATQNKEAHCASR